jgi:hypothetical protein
MDSHILPVGDDIYPDTGGAELLRKIQFPHGLDVANLVAELEGLARKERRQLEKRIKVLLIHLLNRHVMGFG